VPASSPVAAKQTGGSGAGAVASVSGTSITKTSYAHWLAVDEALGAGSAASHRALGYLITSRWVLDEAAHRGVTVSAAQVGARLSHLKHQSFAQPGSFKAFLTRSRESEADLQGRVKIELLESAIAAKVTAGMDSSQRASALASFQRSFQQHWKGLTACKAGYVMEDCSAYHGKPETQAATGSTATGSTSTLSTKATKSTPAAPKAAADASGEVYTAPGAMSIGSSSFERNGEIPTQYTCDGADISPPLEWQNLPAKTAALVLFVIDETATGSASGIRWVVGDISPSAKGVAAGKTPEGGIVGADTQGHSGYGGICPAHGKTSTVEFVLYALSKKIPLSPGFQPAVAESEYGAGKDLLGSAAVTYAVYHRS
jgi:phosphatidylethanolamine-binding protein (PEBP) family uncharacterized protein